MASSFLLKIKTKHGNKILGNKLSSVSTLHELKNAISELTDYPIRNLKIHYSYPPKPLIFSDCDTLEDCGIKNGECLFVEAVNNLDHMFINVQPSKSKTINTVKKPTLPAVEHELPVVDAEDNSEESDMQCSFRENVVNRTEMTSVNLTENHEQSRNGIKEVSDSESSKDAELQEPSENIIKEKDVNDSESSKDAELPPIIEPLVTDSSSGAQQLISDISRPHISGVSKEKKGIIMRKEVPSDNSCLFTSVGFLISGKVDVSVSSFMRQLVAEAIKNNPDEYNEGILGKPVQDYCDWITHPNAWGGGIEISILSNHYGFEIVVANTSTGILNRFGEDKHFETRAFLIFDGIHYDPLYMDFLESDDAIQTMFPTSNQNVLLEVEQLMMEAKASKQYTDVNRFTLLCSMCGAILLGQEDAQIHAVETGHVGFTELNS